MKITIEIEDSVYNTLSELFTPPGLSVELIMGRILTQIAALLAVKPDVLLAIEGESSKVPGYDDIIQRVLKPPPEEK